MSFAVWELNFATLMIIYVRNTHQILISNESFLIHSYNKILLST